LAYQLIQAIVQICKKEGITKKHFSMLPTGGGAFNGFLISCLQQYATKAGITLEIALPDAHIIQFKEALLFALLGVQRAENQTNSLPTVTGASQASIGGAIYQGWKKML
jgi:anhydro-N-acetylmuramic acid kinase